MVVFSFREVEGLIIYRGIKGGHVRERKAPPYVAQSPAHSFVDQKNLTLKIHRGTQNISAISESRQYRKRETG